MTTPLAKPTRPNSSNSGSYSTDPEKYDALVQCDPAADDKFAYAVITTGIYCRPSCKSKRPLRENVRFFANHRAAADAGFRACKRCAPDEAPIEEQMADRITAACHLIESSDSAPTLADLAKAVGISQSHFHRAFKAVVGMTPKAFHNACRANRVREALGKSPSVSDAIYEAGYTSTGRFYANIGETLGMNPASYHSGGKNETIRFAVGECSLGSVLVASTEKGVCAITLGDDPNELAIDLQQRFPAATLQGADQAYEQIVASVIGLIDSPDEINEELPLDIRGTVFQQKVWSALQQIPRGQTATYREIAEKIGSPNAVRAVASACASNSLAVAIPCHRVVRTDGHLSGYRWGVERKRALLEKESSH